MKIFDYIIGFFRNWRRKRRIGKFENWTFPVIKNVDVDQLLAAEIVGVQPMMEPPPNLTIPWKVINPNKPEIGEIYTDGFKVKGESCMCCIRDVWHKIYTHHGWVYERTDPIAFKKAVQRYAKRRNDNYIKE